MPYNQKGGRKLSRADLIPGTQRTLANGAIAGYVMKNGSRVFRIVESSRAAVAGAQAARRNPRQITKAQAQDAFDRYYNRTRTVKRGPRKGSPRFKSPRGRRAARTYDKQHRGANVVSDARYLHNPHAYDFQGVDTGSKARKALSPKQRAALAAGRAKRAANLQRGGYWW